MTPCERGGWRTGTPAAAGAPLATVSADLARSLGRPIDVAPAIAAQRFTGTLALGDGEAGATLTRIAPLLGVVPRSEEHTSELQSLMRISYAVFCLKKKTLNQTSNKATNKQITTRARIRSKQ